LFSAQVEKLALLSKKLEVEKWEVQIANYEFQRIIELVNPRVESFILSLSAFVAIICNEDTKREVGALKGKDYDRPVLPESSTCPPKIRRTLGSTDNGKEKKEGKLGNECTIRNS
jgi:hypothetical protein